MFTSEMKSFSVKEVNWPAVTPDWEENTAEMNDGEGWNWWTFTIKVVGSPTRYVTIKSPDKYLQTFQQ